ncbi:DUF3560 domain-containing protein [Halobacillus ihumii]|uniref:DUF3560 domain-containing protein n=1 Tax=Halobacillus ihumii TaxID=2686092 RepID=UPI0013D209EA|nr:DUF3560 domain-containing protein [Halobacillus ihumii]
MNRGSILKRLEKLEEKKAPKNRVYMVTGGIVDIPEYGPILVGHKDHSSEFKRFKRRLKKARNKPGEHLFIINDVDWQLGIITKEPTIKRV